MALLHSQNLPDAIGFLRLAQIDADNLIYLAEAIKSDPKAIIPRGPSSGSTYIARHILLMKCLFEALEKYFKSVLLVSSQKSYEEIGEFVHDLRGLWRAIPEYVEFANGFKMLIKQELKSFGIGMNRKGYDFLDIDYPQLRYEGGRKIKHKAKRYSIKLSLTTIQKIGKKLGYNLFQIHDTLIRREKRKSKKIKASFLKKPYKAYHEVLFYGDFKSGFEAISNHDEFKLRTRK